MLLTETLGQAATVSPWEALTQAAPTVALMSQQYQRAAPFVDWLIDHPKTMIVMFIGSISLAALIGSIIGVRLERR